MPGSPPIGDSPGSDAVSAPASINRQQKQQELLAELGVLALRHTLFDELLSTAARISAEGLSAEFAKVLEYLPKEGRFLLRAGYGWEPELIGKATVPGDMQSPAGYALKTGQPVISNDLETEGRFRTPELMRRHGMRRAINVILQGDGVAYGVLEVDTRAEGAFHPEDATFLQGAANILGMAIERLARDRELKQALERQTLLIAEISHRVRNSLQLVSSLLNLQAKMASNEELSWALNEAMGRVRAVGRIHERLYRSADVEVVDVSAYLGDLCHDHTNIASHCTIDYQAAEAIPMETDRAVRLALVATELISNATRHAYPAPTNGVIFVRLALADDVERVRLSIRDHGPGLANDFNPSRYNGLGMRVISTLIDQNEGHMSFANQNPGVEFIVELPRGRRGDQDI
jgi:two-component sensor histidine kinase